LKLVYSVLVLVLVVAGVAVGFRLFPGNERIIRRQLHQVAFHASIDGKKSALKKLAQVNRLIDFFAPDLTVQVESAEGGPYHVQGTSELREFMLAGAAQGETVSVEFPGVNVVVNDDKKSAVAHVTAKVVARQETRFLQLKVGLVKSEEGWRVQAVTDP
jgi:hypothetical protein